MAEAQRNQARYCAICGNDATSHGPPIERFGEPFCCEEHAEQFAKEVQAARIQAAALAVQEPDVRQPEKPIARGPVQQGWRRYVKLGACCGAPLLALVILAGGGGALLGSAGALLPYLAALACPLGMYFLMRGMSKMERKEDPQNRGEEK